MLRIIFAILLALSLTACDEIPNENKENKAENSQNNESYEKAKVLYDHDGDTIWVKIDGKKEKVRFV